VEEADDKCPDGAKEDENSRDEAKESGVSEKRGHGFTY